MKCPIFLPFFFFFTILASVKNCIIFKVFITFAIQKVFIVLRALQNTRRQRRWLIMCSGFVRVNSYPISDSKCVFKSFRVKYFYSHTAVNECTSSCLVPNNHTTRYLTVFLKYLEYSNTCICQYIIINVRTRILKNNVIYLFLWCTSKQIHRCSIIIR